MVQRASAPSPRATRSRSGSPAAACAACGAHTLRRARVRGGRATSGAGGTSRTHATMGAAQQAVPQPSTVCGRPGQREGVPARKAAGARGPAGIFGSYERWRSRTTRDIDARTRCAKGTHLTRGASPRTVRGARRAARFFRFRDRRATLRLLAARHKALWLPRACEASRLAKQRTAPSTARLARCAAPPPGVVGCPGARCGSRNRPAALRKQQRLVPADAPLCPRVASAPCVARPRLTRQNCAFRVAAFFTGCAAAFRHAPLAVRSR